MMTYSAPASRTIGALTSPVNAPSFSQNRSCAATATGEFRTASATACTARKAGAIDDVDVGGVLDHAAELFGVHDRVVHGLEHLPVAGDAGVAHGGILQG